MRSVEDLGGKLRHGSSFLTMTDDEPLSDGVVSKLITEDLFELVPLTLLFVLGNVEVVPLKDGVR